MALRTFTAVSMLASLTLVAPASFARGGHGGGGHSSGGHSSGGHSSFGGHSGSSSFGGHSSSSFGSGHASGFGGTGHASFRGSSESSGSSSYGSGHSQSYRSSYGGGHGDTWGSSTHGSHPAIMHTMPPSRADPVPAGPVHVVGSLRVEGRVRSSPTPSTVRGVDGNVAADDGWTPRYRFRVPPAYVSYYTPYTSYSDSTYWVTDWVVTDTMMSEDMEGPGDLGALPMDASVKEELREEIVADMAAPIETEASADDPRIRAALANPSHIFLVSKEVGVQNQKGIACALRSADLVRPLARVAPEDKNVNVVVLAAKSGGCTPGDQVTLAASDLAAFERDLLTRVDHARNAANGGDAAPAADGAAL